MKRSSFAKKRIIHIYAIIFVITIILLIACTLMFKYHVEGEKNLPFNLKKINVISTAESLFNKDEEVVRHAKILQKNDVFFVIEKNNNYKKDETIKKILFENFQIIKSNEDMIINIYKPTTAVDKYVYLPENIIGDSLEYQGSLQTNIEGLQINNQGGIIGFSVASDNIGEYTFEENEILPSDGRLLLKANAKPEDIKFQISFDLIIETNENHKFKSNIKLDLPTGNILEEGVGKLEKNDLKDVIFKRF